VHSAELAEREKPARLAGFSCSLCAAVYRDGVRQEPSAKADTTFSVPRIQFAASRLQLHEVHLRGLHGGFAAGGRGSVALER